jgi:hypothetical protein
MCNGKSAGAGRLIDSGNTMLILGRHDAYSWYDQWRQHNATSLGWSMVGGNTGHLLGVTDKVPMHAEIKHYTNVRIHNEYTLASTVIGTIRYYKTEYNNKKVNCITSYNVFFESSTE